MPDPVRISAARAILYQSRAIELDELGARLGELEQFILRKQEQDALDRAGEDEE